MIRRLCLFAALALASTLALALPSVQQVEAEVAQGRYAQAETMMAEVVAAKPGSARAHYIYAEILAHNELFPRASEQARLARTLDPSLAFAGSADKFRAFERLLERAQAGAATARSSAAATPRETALPPLAAPARATAAAAPAAASGVPSWLWGAGFAVVAVLLWRVISRRSSASAAGAMAPGAMATGAMATGAMAPGGMATNTPYGPGGMPPGAVAPTSRGGGLLGAGLAGAGGFAAGMMVDRMLHPDGSNRGPDRLAGLGPDAGGNVDDAGSDLAGRNVDFGNGGNEWGGDAGGSSDDGGGSDGGGGWDS